MKVNNIFSIAVMLFCLSVINGCGYNGLRGLVPVEGRVTLNGEPLADATVEFAPAELNGGQHGASGVTDASGRFVLKTNTESVGIAPGEYKVVVTKKDFATPLDKKIFDKKSGGSRVEIDGKEVINIVKYKITTGKYGSYKKTDLKETVPAKGNKNVEIKLTL
ncbi:MAG: carboxypeptidase-like regulatory domain-containing protein [Planctomycetaceae bacterium]|jgi:hypothetical protein|nr:carboxypeptidase-like regulatory domain-containing protein [Planctomycetaceae bacterium]